MARILIIYSTTDGHTIKICGHLQKALERQSNLVSVIPIEQAEQTQWGDFDKLVLGASIRYGKHSRQITDFINRNWRLLENKSSAFFSVNLVARKAEKRQPDTNPYLRKFLKRIKWKPRSLAVFAGKLDYPRYDWFDRSMIRLIMWLTKGPTDPKAVVEFTDWEQVEDFARLVDEI
jgi:menaquinone-dependent protoporphyrinogen oxidase